MMKPITQQQAIFFFKQFWQPMVLGFLGLLLLIQFYSLGSSYSEFHIIDTKITQAKDIHVDEEEESDPSNSSGLNRPGRGGPNSNQNQQRRPARNIFKEKKVSFKLSAIYLDKAVINGKDYAVGDQIGNATLIEIGVDYAKIDVEGEDNPQTVQLFQGGGPRPSGGRGGSSRAPSRRSRPSSPSTNESSSQSPQPSQSVESSPPANRGGSGMGMRPSREMMDRFRSMSPEERQQLQERVRNMSPEERREFFSRMR